MAQANSPRKKPYHHGDLKQALLRETARILREEGEGALSLRRLAAELQVSRTAPYNHFKSKQSLLFAVAEEGFERFKKSMQACRDQHRAGGGAALTQALVKAYIDFARNNPEYYNLMYGGSTWQGAEQDKAVVSISRGILRHDIERLKRGQARGQIAADVDLVRYAQMYWGTLHGICRLCLDGVYTDSASIEALCKSTADMLWQQIAPS